MATLLSVSTLLLATMSGCRSADEVVHPPSELVGALLDVNSVGTQWRETQRDAFDVREPENPVIDVGQFCDAARTEAATLESLAGQAGADVEMQVKESTRMLREQAWSNSEVGAFWDAARASVEACDNERWTDENGVSYEFDIIDGPDIGDDVLHWRLVASPPADEPDKMLGTAGRTTIARFGDSIMLLEIGDFAADASAAMISEDEWSTIVSKAGSRIDAL